ncbi:class I SAM-dependent methyltransferase [Microlunatus soli]|uniref:Methyltransferase domain-containing protein n=1 Tax=Microlunatus soli TaxID=630515 RepID=A0A1H1SNB2_9ACTN|nr:class I SAM-dependent methyltransferase [Microlunatus soli]SDS49484.1 hypothetical protein SAMN04489812_2078 [Microlunatus soli]
MAVVTPAGIRRRVVGMLAWARWGVTPYPPGHYHSPIPSLKDVANSTELAVPDSVPGIDLHREDQLSLARAFSDLTADMPFGAEQRAGLRYWLNNTWFGYGDGIALYGMLRHLRPKRYIEIGSGFSSACTLDTADRFLDDLEMTFYEPNPARLRSLLRRSDRVRIVDSPPRHYRSEDFAELEAGDILFIDSSHVVKFGSEVNDLMLDVIPQLPAGVHVHVHDIFWPFTYPAHWIRLGRAWNEAYLLRALLCGNSSLDVTWFADYLGKTARAEVARTLPLWEIDPGGSVWLRRV